MDRFDEIIQRMVDKGQISQETAEIAKKGLALNPLSQAATSRNIQAEFMQLHAEWHTLTIFHEAMRSKDTLDRIIDNHPEIYKMIGKSVLDSDLDLTPDNMKQAARSFVQSWELVIHIADSCLNGLEGAAVILEHLARDCRENETLKEIYEAGRMAQDFEVPDDLSGLDTSL